MAVLLEGIGDDWAIVRRPGGKPELLLFESLTELRRVMTRALVKSRVKTEVKAEAKHRRLPQANLPAQHEGLPPIVLLDEQLIDSPTVPFDVDCRSCGACCAPLDQTESLYAALEEEDVDKIPSFMKNSLIAEEGGRSYMRTKCVDGITVCSAFSGVIGGQGKCGIYSKRPISCQMFEKGSLECLEARAARGL